MPKHSLPAPPTGVIRINRKVRLALKWVLLVLFILVLFTLQSTPGLFQIAGIRPILLIPAAVAVAMFEGEFIGAFVAMGCGLLWDLAGEAPFGAYALLCLLFGVITGLLLRLLLRCEWFNCVVLVLVFSFIVICAEFLFAYAIYGHTHIGTIFLQKHLPVVLYTTAVSPAVFFVVKKIEKLNPGENGKG